MIILSLILLCVIFYISPTLIGALFTSKINRGCADKLSFWYISGFMIMLAVFQIITVPMTLMKMPFHILVLTYTAILMLLMIWSVIQQKNRIIGVLKDVLMLEKWLTFAFALGIFLVLVQMGISTVMMNPNGDDASYIAYANDIVNKDAIFLYSPYTGEYTGIGINKMTLTSWCVFIAFVARVSHLHVLIIAHTVLPFVLIAMAYITYYWIGHVLFGDDNKKIGLYIVFLSLLHIWGGFSIYSLTFRLLQCQWQGKAVAAAIIIPLSLFYAASILDKHMSRHEGTLLALFGIAACGTTLIGGGLFVLVMAAVAILNAISNKKASILIKGLAVCFPCILYCILFLFQYFLTAWIRR